MIIDARNLIYGRLASTVAKQALEGEQVIIVNIEQSIISGAKRYNINLFVRRRERTRVKYPRSPDRVFRRSVRGMLKYNRDRGEAAYKRVKVFIGVPDEYASKAQTIDEINYTKLKLPKYQRLGEICKELGWNG